LEALSLSNGAALALNIARTLFKDIRKAHSKGMSLQMPPELTQLSTLTLRLYNYQKAGPNTAPPSSASAAAAAPAKEVSLRHCALSL